jgi:hypothetical protein
MADLTIILQGVIYNEELTYRIIEKYNPFGKIIVSSYFKKYPHIFDKLMTTYPQIILIDNDETVFKNELISQNNLCTTESDAGNNYLNNYYYQIRSTNMAIPLITTTYTIKTRIDFYFENLSDFIENMILNKDKITNISIYTRNYDFCKIHNLLCHVSDILYGGTSEYIRNISNKEICHFKLEIGCSEDRKFRNHCNNIPSNLFENKHTYSNYMAQLFNIYPINRGNCYYNFKGVTYFNDRIKDTIDYFMEGCDC